MFDTAFIVVDEDARPVLIIPEDLPEGEAFLKIVHGGMDISVGQTVHGQIRDMDDTTLALLGLQEKIGMATFKGTSENDPLPEEIQYVALVSDTRFE